MTGADAAELEWVRGVVKDGVNTPEEATVWLRELGVLRPGEYMAPTGVVIGSGAHPEISRFGADETDNDCLADE
jgi:hypothetical protein